MASKSRHRLQIELRPNELALLTRLRATYGENESEAGRQLLQLFARLAEVVAGGAVITALPANDERAVDAIPELTAAFRPDSRYKFLIRVPHRWRKQLMLKGRRITVGNLITQMEANHLSVEETALDFELPVEAVEEAVDAYRREKDLIDAELAEERRAAEAFGRGPDARPTR